MTSAPNNSFLLSDQYINPFFIVDRDWTPDLLFNYQRLYWTPVEYKLLLNLSWCLEDC